MYNKNRKTYVYKNVARLIFCKSTKNDCIGKFIR